MSERRLYNQITMHYPDGNRISHDEYELFDPRQSGRILLPLLEGAPKGTRVDIAVRVETYLDGALAQEIRSVESFTYHGADREDT